MDLGNLFKKDNIEKTEYFWSLVIGKSWVEAGIWRVVGEKTEVVAEGAAASWEEDNEETLIQAADSALSAAAGSFAESEEADEPNKVVFGLSPQWVEKGTIRKEKLALLKKLSQDLELSPAGFVVLPEAIIHYLKIKEGAPPNIILVGVAEDSVDVSLVENGKIIDTVEVGRSISLSADLTEGLARFKDVEQYPSRIILYNHRTADLEEARQNLLEADWEGEKIKFLHTPKVEILEENAALSAVSLAGGAEVGQAKTVQLAGEEDEEDLEEEAREAEERELREISPEELGFLKGEDIAEKEKKEEEEPQPQPSPHEEKRRIPSGPGPLTKAASSVGAFWSAVLSVRPPGLPAKRSVLTIVSVGLLGFFLLAGVAYWYLPRAQVTVYVAPKRIEKDVPLKIDTGTQVINQEQGIIPGRLAKVDVSGEKTKSTSGTKVVGDRAKGRVTLFRTGPSLTLAEGTILTAENGLRFTLDERTPVASGSGAANPGETEAPVTATDIGAQYNLAAGTVFSVGNFSAGDLQAKNSEAFSGGSSREISAVSEEDRTALEKELTAELKSQGEERIKADLTEGEILIENTSALRNIGRDFSHRVGEEADTLKLDMQAGVEVLVVSKDVLNTFLATQLSRDVSEGYLLRPEQMQVEFKPEEEEDSSLSFTTHAVANLLPKVNPDEIARNIAGKYPDVAKTYLSSIPGFTRAEISLSISFPGRLRTLPRLARNIVIEVAAER